MKNTDFFLGTILSALSFWTLWRRSILADHQIIELQDVLTSPYHSIDWMLVVSLILAVAGLAFIVKGMVSVIKNALPKK